jgi:hypothetical protein
MKLRSTLAAFALFVLPLPVLGLACQSSDDTTPAPSGQGGSVAQGGSSTQGGAGGTNNGGTAGTGQGGATGGNSGVCAGVQKAITDLNQATPPAKTDLVLLKGVVASSQKFLVSASKSGCLWGVYVTTPGAGVDYGSIQIVSKGAAPTTGANGKDVCGTGAAAGMIPDDIAPGDVFDVSGFVSDFLLSSCGMPSTTVPGTNNPLPAVGQRQLSDVNCISTPVKGGPAPEPREISDHAVLDAIASGQNVDDVNRKWSGALVKVTGPLTSAQNPMTDYTGTAATSAVSKFGNIAFSETQLIVTNAIYYTDETCGGPKGSTKRYEYTQPTTFNSLTGIVAINFCTWEVSVRNRCGDIDPPSSVCAADPVCPTGGSGGATGTPENTAELCADGQDNDGNGFVDCNDKGCCSVVDCSGMPTSYCGKKGAGGAGGSTGSGENTVALCSDGIDNDGNNFVDCNDKGCCGVVDCSAMPTSYCGKKGAGGAGGAGGASGTPENTAALCADGQDNDGNGFIDCNDKGCCSVVDCSADPTSYCGKKGAGGSGGASGTPENTVALCSDGIDNDGNKYIDCNDKGCCGVVSCTSMPTSYCGKMGM